MLNIETTIEDFCQILSDKLDKLTSHHFIAKHQSSALRNQKVALGATEVVVIGDFAENYSFVVQDAVQGWHRVNSHATLHPFVLCYRDEISNEVKHYSLCVISNHMKHETNTVYAFQKEVLIKFIKQNLSRVTKVIYFTDGSGAQYKNFKNFQNMCLHEEDFGLCCEWNFFATSHGKGPCDGIGGVVKRHATRFSKQLVKSGQDRLLTPYQLYEYAKENLEKVQVSYVSSEVVAQHTAFLEERYSTKYKVPGCRDQHRLNPSLLPRSEFIDCQGYQTKKTCLRDI